MISQFSHFCFTDEAQYVFSQRTSELEYIPKQDLVSSFREIDVDKRGVAIESKLILMLASLQVDEIASST